MLPTGIVSAVGRASYGHRVDSPRSSARAVVFDIGGVLSAPEGAVPQVAAALGLPLDVVAGAYWDPRDAYDRGSAREDYWAAVGAILGLDLSGARGRDLDDLDARRWGTVDPASQALLDEVSAASRDGGPRLAVLSNAPLSLARVVRAAAWSAPFEVLVFSAELRVAKPEPAIYDAVERALGLAGEELVFFDDRPVNVEAAVSRGWRAHLWQGAGTARERLVEEGLLPG